MANKLVQIHFDFLVRLALRCHISLLNWQNPSTRAGFHLENLDRERSKPRSGWHLPVSG